MSKESPFSEQFGPGNAVEKDPKAVAEEIEFIHDGDDVMYRVWYDGRRVGSWKSTGLCGGDPSDAIMKKKRALEREHGI